MRHKRMAAFLVATGVLASGLFAGCSSGSGAGTGTTSDNDTTSAPDITTAPSVSAPADDEGLNSLSALELSKLMGNGINLGNTMEAYGHKSYVSGSDPTSFETLWGQPTTTQEMIDDMKEMGFDTIRIPVAWTNGMNFESGDYTIDERLMARVEEIVNYALNADMFVIINDHWDGGWWGMFGSADQSVRDKGMEMYKSMWTQIAQRFSDYSYKLIFESANEELGDRLNDSDITGSKGVLNQAECYEKAYEINSEFVKLIRSTGGKNADRFLLIAGYNTDIQRTCDERFKMPEDTADEKLFLSVHYYTPWDYCGTDGVNQWGSPTDLEEQNGLLEDLSKFTEQGYGVIIGEYAVMKSDGGIKPDTDKFYTNFLDNCDLYNYCPVLWDCSNLYKRKSGIVSDENVAAIFSSRDAESEKGKDYSEIQSDAQEAIDALYDEAVEKLNESIALPPSDDMAIAWIMYQSSDWNIAYSVGDTYDPTNMTTGVKATNVQVTGEGTYTVALDLSALNAYGFAFSALGISNGETFFPGYIVDIAEIKINGEVYTPTGDDYTSSDDGKCTRVNLYNQWVPAAPSDSRIVGGDLSNATPKLIETDERIETLEITFDYIAP